MKNTLMLSILFLLIFTISNGQTKEKREKYTKKSQPETNIKVNKEYDENGNLIKYDSTYSYYYTNIENDTILEDSVLNQFKNYFNNKYFFSEDPFFNDFFFQDSLLNFDFYTKDFFINRFKNNTNQINQLFLEMDSMKNLFFMKQFQDTLQYDK